jgi:dihydroorotate dehydrogenase electron transfer subunit
MLRIADLNDPLLARPLALYDTVVDDRQSPRWFDVVYLTQGKMTRRLAQLAPQAELDIWGPLGNGFPPIPTSHLIMVAGGIGQTPFLALGKEYLGGGQSGEPVRQIPRAERVTLCYGVRSADLLAGVPDFRAAGIDVHVSSDDGSVGHHGLVTDLLSRVLDETRGEDRLVVCCGPEPMMEAVADVCALHQARCLVSLETPMACGIGICFSCVAKVRQDDGSWDWKRTCVEGPVLMRPISFGDTTAPKAASQRLAGCIMQRRYVRKFLTLEPFNRVREPRLGARRRIGMNHLVRRRLVDLFHEHAKLHLALLDILRGDRFANLPDLRPQAGLRRTVAGAADGILPHALLGTRCIGHRS